jgi:hypothetical protein
VDYGLRADVLGETGGDSVEIKIGVDIAISAAISEFREAYEGALEKALRTGPDAAAAD